MYERAAIDGLWQCLCPTWATTSRKVSSKALISPRWVCTRRYMHTIPSHSSRSPSSNFRPRLGPGIDKVGKLYTFSTRSGSIGEDTRSHLASRSLGRLYEELRSFAGSGQYNRAFELAAYIVKDRKERPDLWLYTSLLLANASPEEGSAAEVALLWEEMIDAGIAPDAAACHAALKALAVHPDYLFREEILAQMRARWFTLSLDGQHDNIAALIRERQFERALGELEEMQRKDLRIRPWLHDLLVYNLCDVGEFAAALRILKFRSKRFDATISGTVWYYLLDTASQAFDYEATLYAWKKRVEPEYLNPSTGICLNVLSTAARAGDISLATDVFRILGERSTVLSAIHYEALSEAYVNRGDIKTSLAILCIMQNAGLSPQEATMRPIYSSLAADPEAPQQAFVALQELHNGGRAIPTAALNCIIEADVAQGQLDRAVDHYKALHTLCSDGPSTATFNALFRGCNKAGRKDLAMFLASEMLALKVQPDALTYDRLLLVCLQEDDYEDAFRYYSEMKEQGWVPRQGTLVALVRKCTNNGDKRTWDVLDIMRRTNGEATNMERWVEENWPAESYTNQPSPSIRSGKIKPE